MTRYILPYPPSVNHVYGQRPGGHGRARYLTKEGAAFHREVAYATAPVRPDHAKEGPVLVAMEFHPKDRRRRDSHNAIKILLDALVSAGVLVDDKDDVVVSGRWTVGHRDPCGSVIVDIDNAFVEGEEDER